MPFAVRLLGVITPIALVVVLITTNVRLAANSVPLQTILFDRHGVSTQSGILPSDLTVVASALESYLTNGSAEPLQIMAPVQGNIRPLLSSRESTHMKDVKSLFALTFRAQEVAAFILVISAAFSFFRSWPRPWTFFLRWIRRGALITVLLIVAISLASTLAFGPLFTVFHQIGFRNDLWLLNPQTDLLLSLYPLGFWRDAVLLIGLATLIQATLIFMLPTVITRLSKPSSSRIS